MRNSIKKEIREFLNNLIIKKKMKTNNVCKKEDKAYV